MCLSYNVVYIKMPKTGSSAVGGIMRRIAARYGLSGVAVHDACSLRKLPEPKVCAGHGKAAVLERVPLQLPVVRITFVREPIERYLSAYYHFQVSRRGAGAKSENIINYLRGVEGDMQRNYMNRHGETDPSSLTLKNLMAQYTFVGVTERMSESLVVMRYVLGLPSWCGLLFLPTKVSTGKPHKDDIGVTFVPHVPLAQQPPAVRDFAASEEFRAKMASDRELHAAVNAKLDWWIDKIGRGTFIRQVADFERILHASQEQCAHKESASTCYWNDNGCGYPCLDIVCAELERTSETRMTT
jgi:hypothetical protein